MMTNLLKSMEEARKGDRAAVKKFVKEHPINEQDAAELERIFKTSDEKK